LTFHDQNNFPGFPDPGNFTKNFQDYPYMGTLNDSYSTGSRQCICLHLSYHFWSSCEHDLSTSKSNQLISVPQSTEIVNMVKSPQAVYEIIFTNLGTRAWTVNPKNTMHKNLFHSHSNTACVLSQEKYS